MTYTPDQIRYQVEILILHKGRIYSTSEIKELFDIPKSTYIKDTWLWHRLFLEYIEHNTWRIRGFA